MSKKKIQIKNLEEGDIEKATLDSPGEVEEVNEETAADATISPEGESEETDDLESRLATMTANWQRERADFINYRRRVEEEKSTIRKNAIFDLSFDLLRVVDYFESSVSFAENLPGEAKSVIDGVEYTMKELTRVLTAHGVTPIEVEIGDEYDSSLMEAVERRGRDDQEPGTILEIQRRGWRLHDRVLRSAQVVVAMAPDDRDEGEDEREGGDINNSKLHGR